MAEKLVAKNDKRENGEGRIFPRKGTRLLWCQYYLHGQQIRISTGTDNPKKAAKFLKRKLAEVLTDTHADPRRVTYKSLRDAYLDDCEMKNIKSLRRDAQGVPYLEAVKRLDTHFADLLVSEIDADEMRNFQKKLRAEGYSNGSINRSMASLRRAFTLAARDGKIRTLPFFPMLPEAKPRKDTLPHDRYKVLLEALPDYLQLPVRIGYHTGMRRGEILGLTWENNINWMERFIRIEDSKSGDPRVIPFSDELEKLLEVQYASRQECDRVCFRIDRRGHAQPLGNFRKVWRRACIKLGLGKMTPVLDSAGNPVFEKPRYATSKPKPKMVYSGLLFHGLRRTFVTDAENAGVARHEAMKLSGHKTENTYKRYAIENLNRRRAAVATIDAYRAMQLDASGDISGTVEVSAKQGESVIN